MAHKKLKVDTGARGALEAGVNKLAGAVVGEGLKNLAADANPIILRRGIEKTVEAAIESILSPARRAMPYPHPEDRSERTDHVLIKPR